MRDEEFEGIHSVWNEFCDKFWGGKSEDENGYRNDEIMDKIEEWAKSHPKDVHISWCDDDTHMTSMLVWILHRNTRGQNWGTTLLFISQKPVPITQMFFYPNKIDQMGEIIKKIKLVPIAERLAVYGKEKDGKDSSGEHEKREV